MLPIEALQEKIDHSELGQEWIHDPLMNKDVWSVEELGYTKEESKIVGTRNIYFEEFSLPWLKLLTKLTIKASVREKCSLRVVSNRIIYLRQFSKFLVIKGYVSPELITDNLLKEFIYLGCINKRQSTIAYITKLWAEEQWLKLPYTP